jgi:integrase
MPGRKQPAPPKRRPRNTGSVFVRASDQRIGAILPPDLDPKRRPVYGWGKGRPFTDAGDAAAWLAAEVARLRDPTPGGATRREPLGAYLARWYALHAPGWPERTASAYAVSLRRFGAIGDVPLGELTHEHIQGVIAHLQATTWAYRRRDGRPTSPARRYAPSTIAHARSTLRLALADLVPEILPANPVARTRLGRRQPYQGPVWSEGQAARFVEQAGLLRPDLALALELIVRRALRPGEALALRWDDVDERRRLLRIDATQGARKGLAGDTKGRRVRRVPLSAHLLARLAEHRAHRSVASPWVFAAPDGDPWSRETLRALAKRAMAAAGLPPIGVRDLRATCATVALGEGVPLPVVSALLGHASTAITASRYARVIEGRLDEAAALIDRALDAPDERAPTPLREAE